MTVVKKKILLVTRNLPPLIGGMERLNWHIADELSKNHEVIILSHHQAKISVPKNCKIYSVFLNPLPFFLFLAFMKTFFLCLHKKPDILLAGSGLTAPIIVFWAKVFNKKSIVYVHGLDIGTNNKLYNLIWIPFIKDANQVIANSLPTYNICQKKDIMEYKLDIIHPGVSYPSKPKNNLQIEELRKKYQLDGKKVLISVGRLTQRKGLNEFIELSFSDITKTYPNTVLIIIGDTPDHSLNKNLQSKDLLISTAKKYNIENHIIFAGNISNDAILSSLYYLADIHVFPVKHIPDDPEGFGMVAIEAAAHGIPTVAFSTGGIVDAVENERTGYLIENQDYQEMTNTVIQILQNKKIISEHTCIQYAEQFSWYNFRNKFEQILVKL